MSNTSTALLRGGYVFSAKTSGELVCLEASTGKQIWQTNTVTDLKNGSSIHLTPCGEAVFLFTDRGDLIRAELAPVGIGDNRNVMTTVSSNESAVAPAISSHV